MRALLYPGSASESGPAEKRKPSIVMRNSKFLRHRINYFSLIFFQDLCL